ncbi:MAG TPA: multicopper oxidase domain-containing protein [Nitrospira sp.]|nr:multicopper oxidase domain-containing protein [Nitrospira sp.]
MTTGIPCMAALLLLIVAVPAPAATREYYVAAEAAEWDYARSGKDLTHGAPLPDEWRGRTIWRKVRFVEYADGEFKDRKPQPDWLGILGPVIRAEVGDTVVVHFYNKADQPYSMHPHGLRYVKDHEGAQYDPAGRGARVKPGERHTYVWIADEMSGPGPRDPSSIVWWYHSHVHEPDEIQKGLLGPIIVTARGRARPDGTPSDIEREFITAYVIFKEQLKSEAAQDTQVEMFSINGLIFGNLRGLKMRNGERVRWYVLGMGNEQDLHTVHWHGKTVDAYGRHTDVIEILPASMVTVTMTADNPGTWLYHCHVDEHLRSGMHTRFTIIE